MDKQPLFEFFQSEDDMIKCSTTQISETTKLLSDVLICFFQESPFGKTYLNKYVRPSDKVPLSDLYDRLIDAEHRQHVQVERDSYVVQIKPKCKEIANEFHLITIHEVSADKHVVKDPLEAFIILPYENKIIKCPTSYHADDMLLKNILNNSHAAIDMWIVQNQEFEKSEKW